MPAYHPPNLPWVEKFRPQTLDQICGNQANVRIRKIFSHKQKNLFLVHKYLALNTLPHLLLHGPPGTGKTSAALATAKALHQNQLSNIIELNASDDRGIDVVRNQIKTFAETQSIANQTHPLPKIIILDEADQMTNAAQDSLRRIMEIYATNARFILICNYVTKIHSAIASRCTKLKFAPLQSQHGTQFIQRVVKAQNITIPISAIQTLTQICKGDMRRAINALQITAMAQNNQITPQNLWATLGLPPQHVIDQVYQTLKDSHLQNSCIQIYKATQECSLLDIIRGCSERAKNDNLTEYALIQLLIRLGVIEERLCAGCSENFQTGALAAAFVEAQLPFLP